MCETVVVIRPFEASDLPILQQIRGDLELQHLLLANPSPESMASAADWVVRRESKDWFRILALQSGDPIGFVQLIDIHYKNRFAWLGIALCRSAQNRGIGERAMQLLEKHAKAELSLRKLMLYVRADNVRAIRLYDNLNYIKVGVLSDHYDDGETLHDVVIMEKNLEKL